jgi:hypothetical protein
MRLTQRTAQLIAALLVVIVARTTAAQPASDDASIRATIGEYFRGHATADSTVMRRPFLPSAHIEGMRQGKFVSWTVDQYVAGYRGTPAADEASRTRRIDEISISGSAAMAKATLDHGAIVFTDYFVLLKVDGAWKIANKVYHAEPKSR